MLYEDFLRFFKAEIATKGTEQTLQKFIFARDERADDMMARMLGGTRAFCVHLSLLLFLNPKGSLTFFQQQAFYTR